MAAVFALLACLGLEFILRRNYAGQGTPRSKLRVFLPWPMYTAFAIAGGLVLALINAHSVATSGSPNSWDGMDSPATMYWVPGIAALTVLAVGMGAVWLRSSLTATP